MNNAPGDTIAACLVISGHQRTSRSEFGFEPHGIADGLDANLVEFGDPLDGAFDSHGLGENQCGNALASDDRLAEAAAGIENDACLFAKGPPAKDAIAVVLEAVEVGLENAPEHGLTVEQVDELRFVRLRGDVRENAAAVGLEAMAAERVITELRRRAIDGPAKNGPCHAFGQKCVNAPHFHQIQKIELCDFGRGGKAFPQDRCGVADRRATLVRVALQPAPDARGCQSCKARRFLQRVEPAVQERSGFVGRQVHGGLAFSIRLQTLHEFTE